MLLMNLKYLVDLLYNTVGGDDIRLDDPDGVTLGNTVTGEAHAIQRGVQGTGAPSEGHHSGRIVLILHYKLSHEVAGEGKSVEYIFPQERYALTALAGIAGIVVQDSHAVIDQGSGIGISICDEGGIRRR